jgi:hypothetical protein
MAAGGRDALRHVGKVLVVLAGVGVAYSLALVGVHLRGPGSVGSPLAPQATSWQACLAAGWRTALYAPLFWVTTSLVFIVYNFVTREIDPQQ